MTKNNKAQTHMHKSLSFIIPVYMNNGEQLAHMLYHYNSFPVELKESINIVLIDDCSPVSIEIPDDINLNIQIYSILDDIPWNIPGARNLGVLVAETENIILLDVDHHLSIDATDAMLKANLREKEIWKFKRFKKGENINPHPVTYFMKKRLYLKLSGCDEDMSGNYGSDSHLRECVAKLQCDVRQTDYRIDVASNKVTASQHTLIRDTTHNKAIMAVKNKDPLALHSKKHLRFKWEFSAEYRVEK